MSNIEKYFSDSSLEKRFLKLLQNPEIRVVSFDIFDTLFFRKCGEAKNVFEIMGAHKEVEAIFDTPSVFSLYRQNAEKFARRAAIETEEITLAQIYAQLPLSAEASTRLQKIELETETEMLVQNRQLERWIALAHAANKRVILISDMYLSSTQIKTIALSKLNTQNLIEKCFVSSEYAKTKATGNLFLDVLSELGINAHELLHIGDNERSDILIAINFNIHTLYYGANSAQKERLKHERAYMQEEFTTANEIRVMSSLLTPYEDKHMSFYFDLGASIFAPLLWEFSHYLAKISERFDSDSLVFVMREGAIFQECFSTLYPEIKTKLLYASRKSTQFLHLNAEDLGSVNWSTHKRFTIENLYESFFLEIDDKTIQNYAQVELHETQNIILENSTLFEFVQEDLKTKKELMQKAMESQESLLLEYLQNLELTPKSLLIDFGGGGTILKRIMEFLPEHIAPQMGLLFYEHAQGHANLVGKHILSFLPLTKKSANAIESIHRSPEFIEILLNGIQETTLKYFYDTEVKPKTIVPNANTKNINTITEALHQGIQTFFALAKESELQAQSFEREKLTLMLARLIELPTGDEVKFLGSLEYDEGKGSSGVYKLIDKQKIDFIQSKGIERSYEKFRINPSLYRQTTPWMEGIITTIKPSYLLGFYKKNNNPNQEVIAKLLEKLDASDEKSVMIYGAGELFLQLLPHLQERKIEIEAVIDTRAETKPFVVQGYSIISLFDALKDKESASIVVASGVYASLISSKIENYSQSNSKNILIHSI